MIVHKAKFKTLPPTLQIKFNLNSDVVKPTLRSAGHFKITYVRTSLKQRCISIRGVSIYNSLPLNVKSVVNTNTSSRNDSSVQHLIRMFEKHLNPQFHCYNKKKL